MTPTNAQELEELAKLRARVEELEKSVQISCWHYDESSGFYKCCHCGAWDVNIDGSANDKHEADCIVRQLQEEPSE